MEKTVEIPEGYEARIESNKVILEPKENEDERVRKAIKMYVEDMPDTFGFAHGIVKEDMLAYLERQKEQKAIEGVIKNITKNKEAATKFLKSAGIMDENGELAKMYRSEQKPAEWSEEDEEMFAGIIADIKFTQRAHNHDVNQIVYEREIDWLKSIRDNYKKCNSRWKPSEEQMDAIQYVSNFDYGGHRKALESLYNDLKKL